MNKMSTSELDAAVARFATRAEADAAADTAMPRRKHDRPFTQFVGAYDAYTVWAPGNLLLLRDGRMYNYVTGRTVRP